MRSILQLCSVAAGAFAGSGLAVTLATDYGAERVLVIESESTLEMRTTEFEITRDGEPMGTGLGEDYESVDERRVVVRERVAESSDGVPMRVERDFQEVEGVAKRSVAGNDTEEALACPLNGVTLRLRREGDEIEVEVSDGEPPDEELLEGHILELALDACLPPGEVDEKSEWELSNAAIRRLLGFDVASVLFPMHEEDDDEGGGWRRGRSGSRGFGRLATAKWSGIATLVSTAEDYAGERCARIELELESLEGEGGGHGARSGAGSLHSFAAELRGYALFSLDTCRPMLLELDGDVDVVTYTSSRERDGATIDFHSRLEGHFTYRVELAVEEAEADEGG